MVVARANNAMSFLFSPVTVGPSFTGSPYVQVQRSPLCVSHPESESASHSWIAISVDAEIKNQGIKMSKMRFWNPLALLDLANLTRTRLFSESTANI
jgi:hypothetical protein